MKKSDFYFLTNENNCYTIHIPSYQIIKMPKKTFADFKSYLISSKNSKENFHFAKLYNNLENKAKEIKNSEIKSSIERLMVLTSTACNLKCVYCYADTGSYGYKREVMSPSVGMKAVRFFTKNFGNIENVTFFGGEPTFSVSTIETICKEFESLLLKGGISKIPEFGIITNGTILNDLLISVYRRYKFAITVSFDGPKEIHDSLRMFRNNKGSFGKILNNIKKLIDKCGDVCVIAYEVTFTKKHLEAGFTQKTLKDIIYNLTGLKRGIVIPVMEPCAQFLKLSSNEIHTVLDEEPNIYELYEHKGSIAELLKTTEFKRWLGIFIYKKFHPYICPIGYSVFSIMPNGDIYPCHLLASNRDFLMGNIFSSNQLNDCLSAKSVLSKLSFIVKEHNDKCSNCIARNFCGSCPAKFLIENNFSPRVPKGHCIETQEKTEKFFNWLINTREDEKHWNELLHSFKKNEKVDIY